MQGYVVHAGRQKLQVKGGGITAKPCFFVHRFAGIVRDMNEAVIQGLINSDGNCTRTRVWACKGHQNILIMGVDSIFKYCNQSVCGCDSY